MTILAQYPASSKKKIKYRFNLGYSMLSLVLIVDQLLLPMFHIGELSFKIGYLVLGVWLINWLNSSRKNVDETKDINQVFGVFSIIISCSILGEMWLASSYNVPFYDDTLRNITAFIFASLAFGLGRSSKRFRFEWLLNVLFCAIALNLAFIIFKNDLPSWLITFYYPEKATGDSVGFQSVEDIIALARPRGLFGNPNASMLMVNIIVLAICIALRKKIIVIKSLWSAVSLIILPVLLAVLLASRGEFIVSCVLGYLNFKTLRNNFGRSLKFTIIFTPLSFVIAAVFLMGSLGDNFSSNVDRALAVAEVLDNSEEKESTIARPLIQLNTFIDRFQKSPIFGTGISSADAIQFSQGTQYFHNDWFYIATISGIIGFFSIFWLMSHLARRLGWPVLIPFFFPGLVNTFILNVPALIGYFAMIGILLASIQFRLQFNSQKGSRIL